MWRNALYNLRGTDDITTQGLLKLASAIINRFRRPDGTAIRKVFFNQLLNHGTTRGPARNDKLPNEDVVEGVRVTTTENPVTPASPVSLTVRIEEEKYRAVTSLSQAMMTMTDPDQLARTLLLLERCMGAMPVVSVVATPSPTQPLALPAPPQSPTAPTTKKRRRPELDIKEFVRFLVEEREFECKPEEVLLEHHHHHCRDGVSGCACSYWHVSHPDLKSEWARFCKDHREFECIADKKLFTALEAIGLQSDFEFKWEPSKKQDKNGKTIYKNVKQHPEKMVWGLRRRTPPALIYDSKTHTYVYET